MHRELSRVLVVEDNRDVRHAIARMLAGLGAQVLEAATAREAVALLQPAPDALIIDVRLPDGSAFDVLEAAQAVWPAPVKIGISGVASPDEAFRLAQFGVRDYLQKPVSLDALESALREACEHEPPLLPLIQEAVGHVPVRQMQRNVREVMVRQALALSRGSRSGAARLLQVTRQAVQQMIRPERLRDGRGAGRPRKMACAPKDQHPS